MKTVGDRALAQTEKFKSWSYLKFNLMKNLMLILFLADCPDLLGSWVGFL